MQIFKLLRSELFCCCKFARRHKSTLCPEYFVTRTKYVFYLLFTVPSSSPEDIRCAPLTSTSLQVSWQPPHENYQNGLLQGYKINFEPIVDYTGTYF